MEEFYTERQRRILLCLERCVVRMQTFGALVQANATRKQTRPPRHVVARSLEELLAELRM